MRVRFFIMGDSLIYLIFINASFKDLLPLLEEIHSLLEIRNYPTFLAISGIGKGFDEMSACFHDVIDASRIFRHIKAENLMISIDDYRFEQTLMHSCSNDQFKNIYNKILSPVKAYDTLNVTDPEKTLYIYCSHCGSKQKTAAKLYLHRKYPTISPEKVRINNEYFIIR